LSNHVLPFEKRLIEIEQSLQVAETEELRQSLHRELTEERERVRGSMSAWDRIQVARHPNRPRMLDFTARVFEEFIELHGDRMDGDDPAMVCGIARFQGRTVFVAGQQKGVKTEEKVLRNFGMAHPEGYRKAARIFSMAERLGHPIVTFVDTPAAHPGIEAEQRGQGPAIAENLRMMMGLRTPVLAIVLSEGGSGGALAIAVADTIAMLENAVYMICPPERCAEILWRDVNRKEDAATALRVTAGDLLDLGVIDTIVQEGPCGAHRDPEPAVQGLRATVAAFLEANPLGMKADVDARMKKFARMGRWVEETGGGHT
jgi:acetyl-CoA carboxylase carboxyl transferase subunit alpha